MSLIQHTNSTGRTGSDSACVELEWLTRVELDVHLALIEDDFALDLRLPIFSDRKQAQRNLPVMQE